ncbi:MAG: ABC transporter ATP-binding protein [Polyangiaceae bacterium]|nr:ABC transporter ATP-binding protein [Polyangiaceae bacterium]
MSGQEPTSQQRYQQFIKQRSTLERAMFARTEASRSERKHLRRQYLEWLLPHKWQVGVVFLLSLVGIAVDMVWPLLSGYLIDKVILNSALTTTKKVETIALASAGMLALFLLNSGMNWVRSLRMQLLNSNLAFSLRALLYRRVLRLPLQEINAMKTGGIVSRLSNDVDNTTGLLQQAVISPTLSTLRLVATLSIIVMLNWKIALAVMVAIPPILLVQNLWAKRVRLVWKSSRQDRQEIDARVSEALNGIRIVRGFQRETREEREYTVGHHTVIRKQMLITRMQRSVAMIWELILPITQLTVIAYGGYLVVMGETTVGTLVAFQGYVWRLLEPIIQLSNSISETQRSFASMERVFEVLDKPAEMPDAPHAVEPKSPIESIEFDHVHFAYRPDLVVIQDFHLTVPAGSVVALVGPSGAGKTTVTDLVARFYDPTSGAIRINGIDLRELRLRSYRSLLGIVAQEVFLFDGSVRENIAYGRKSAAHSEIVGAAMRANAHEFIEQLPEGYNTLIGERGVKLSGGQRQRLSIARALLADPKILILDEATSNLDTESEQLIQASIAELLKNRTTFVIAHRLSTITDANVIVVMDGGRIEELGTHDELMKKRGMYFQMVERQRQRELSGEHGALEWAPAPG